MSEMHMRGMEPHRRLYSALLEIYFIPCVSVPPCFHRSNIIVNLRGSPLPLHLFPPPLAPPRPSPRLVLRDRPPSANRSYWQYNSTQAYRKQFPGRHQGFDLHWLRLLINQKPFDVHSNPKPWKTPKIWWDVVFIYMIIFKTWTMFLILWRTAREGIINDQVSA